MQYHMLRMDKILEQLEISRYITTKGYYQVPVKEDDHKKTVFTSLLGKLEFVKCHLV